MLPRLAPIIAFGTGRYPEKVARRLRAVNISAWFGAAGVAVFVLKDPTDIDPLTVAAALAMAAVPLLHGLGSAVAAAALVLVAFAHVTRLGHAIGTGDGIWMAYLTVAPLSILLFGAERAAIAGVLAILGAGAAMFLRVTRPFDTGYLPPDIQTLNFCVNFVINTALLFLVVYYVSRNAARAEAAAEREYARSESLLVNILPPQIAARLKDEEIIADHYDSASVLFADMAGFTERASDTAPRDLVRFLDGVYGRLDDLVAAHGAEKIKTTGDAYIVVAGVPEPHPRPAEALADLALAMRAALAGLADPKGRAVPIRIGIASGPVVAGVVGRRKFFYDVWGDTVNVAARMEQTCDPGEIQVAPETRALLAERFALRDRGTIEVRGKGRMHTWYLEGRRA